MSTASATPTKVTYAGHGPRRLSGFEVRREGSFILVASSAHPNAPRHWVPASKVQAA